MCRRPYSYFPAPNSKSVPRPPSVICLHSNNSRARISPDVASKDNVQAQADGSQRRDNQRGQLTPDVSALLSAQVPAFKHAGQDTECLRPPRKTVSFSCLPPPGMLSEKMEKGSRDNPPEGDSVSSCSPPSLRRPESKSEEMSSTRQSCRLEERREKEASPARRGTERPSSMSPSSSLAENPSLVARRGERREINNHPDQSHYYGEPRGLGTCGSKTGRTLSGEIQRAGHTERPRTSLLHEQCKSTASVSFKVWL